MKYRYQKFIRIMYSAFVVFVLGVFLISALWVSFHTEQSLIIWIAAGSSFLLFILTGEAVQECFRHIRKRGYTQGIQAMSREAPLISALRKLSRGHKERVDKIVPQDFVYVQREDGSQNKVYINDVYQALLKDKSRPSVLRQQDWVTTKIIDRAYLDDMRLVCLQAGVVRRKGNGALLLLHQPGYAIELIKRHFYN